MAYRRNLNRKVRLSENRDMYEKRHHEGIEEERQENLYHNVLKFFQCSVPQEESSFLEGLIYEVYEKILDMLFSGQSLEDMKKIIKMNQESKDVLIFLKVYE